MCGIYGVLDLDGRQIERRNLDAMASVLHHRGPDDGGSLRCGPVVLGFRRLSIIDVAGGHQPMANEDGTIRIVFNGEIYNHPELRVVLEERGHRYATNSDTETILHLYEEYGDACVDHLRGMFAFAIWDGRKDSLFCARDRMGIKPFYYAIAGNRFAFASEIKALFELPGFHPRLNRCALPEFFALGYMSSEQTLFDGVCKLLPGHRLRLDLRQTDPKPQIEQYWDVRAFPEECGMRESDYVEQFHELFTDTVRIHLRSDVPLGVFLSGGIDSSSIAAVAANLQKAPIQTFSVGFADEKYSELPFARLMARHIGAEHHEIILRPEDFFSSLPLLIWHEDEPLVWPSSVALYFVSRLASQKVKVVLSGEGADEVWAGYLKYRVTLWNLLGGAPYRKLVPSGLRRLVRETLASGLLPDGIRRKLRHTFLYHPDAFENLYFDNFYSVFPQDQQPELFTEQVSEELKDVSAYANSMRFFVPGAPGNVLNQLLYLDMKTYLVELLMKQDQMSMANSIESRVPFLDHKLVEFAAKTPARYKIRSFSGKYLLRRTMAKQLPPEIVRRSKKGFPTPIRPWLRNQLSDKLRSILLDGRTAERGIIQAPYVRKLLSAHQNGHAAATEGCWRLLNFELWSRVFLDGDRSLIPAQAFDTGAAALAG
jgi:asparagine synthase (glutamine-hydrolysing)